MLIELLGSGHGKTKRKNPFADLVSAQTLHESSISPNLCDGRLGDDWIFRSFATRAVPNGEPWGKFPELGEQFTSKACMTHKALTNSFTTSAFEGVLFVAGPAMVKDDKGKNFGSELSALANGWIRDFRRKKKFLRAMPSKELAPEITAPPGIKGEVKVIEIKAWNDCNGVNDAVTR